MCVRVSSFHLQDAVSIAQGGIIPKPAEWKDENRPHQIAVEDVQAKGRNMGTKSFAIKRFREAMRTASWQLDNVSDDEAKEAAEPSTMRGMDGNMVFVRTNLNSLPPPLLSMKCAYLPKTLPCVHSSLSLSLSLCGLYVASQCFFCICVCVHARMCGVVGCI